MPGGTWSNINDAISGSTAASQAARIATITDTLPGPATRVLLNLGVNDWDAGATKAAWESDMTTIIHGIHAKFPSMQVYISRPWQRGHDTDATTYSGWIDDLIAADPSYVHGGDDEAVWLKGGDNGATNTSDGKHYSAAGETAKAAATKTAIGY